MRAFFFTFHQKRTQLRARLLILCGLFCVVCCGLLSGESVAQTAAQKTRAIELVRRAADVFGRGQYAQTIQLCREAVRSDPKYVRAYTWLGAAYQKTGRYAEARNAFGRVLQLAPTSSDATRAQRGLRELNALARAGKTNEKPVASVPESDEKPLLMWRAHAAGVRDMTWSPDSQILASGGGDHVIRLWDARNGAALGAWKGHGGEVTGVAWSPDGKSLASSSYDNTVRLWNNSGQLLREWDGNGFDFNDVAWSPDNRWVAAGAGDGKIWIWDAQSGRNLQLLRGHDNGVTHVKFGLLAGQTVLLSSGLDSTVRVWDAQSGRALHMLSREGPAISALSSDGARFSSGNGNTIRLHATNMGTLLRSLDVPRTSLQSLAWSPDDNSIAAGYYQNLVRVWDTRSGNVTRVLRGLMSGVRSVQFSPDNRFLASGTQDGSIAIWRR